MPELPEVETVARTLRTGTPALIGQTIRDVLVLWPRQVAHPSPTAFAQGLSGARIQAVDRYGKYLLIGLRTSQGCQEADSVLLVHLRMSGRLELVPEAQAVTRHARLVWRLDGGLALRFEDARKFGRAWWVTDPAVVLGKLGPDALAISAEVFVARARSRRGALKPLLLDQSFIAGIGNIYADESLYLSDLHPKRLVATLNEAELLRLHTAIQYVLRAGIAANGASVDWVYPGGHFQEHFAVYGRAGQPCHRCGQPIQRILVAQRSTFFCPSCQPS
jgi:formamidopyrimidine-DNA glycosylase